MTSTTSSGLAPGYRLNEYTIVRELSSGGFSVVYLALDERDAKFAIKEYLPQSLARRGAGANVTVLSELDRTTFQLGLRCFFDEGRVLASIRHPNIVRVSNFFRANQTVYMVMDYTVGRPLSREIELNPQGLAEPLLRRVFAEVVAGLREVHRHHLLHLDIKPANIYLRRSGSPILLDFGAARQAIVQETQSFSAMYTPGYAAPEQFTGQREGLGPWTDLYALGASLHAAMGAGVPPPANARMKQDDYQPLIATGRAKAYSRELRALVDQCLQLDPQQRPGSLLELQKHLNAPYTAPQPFGRGGVMERVSGWLRSLGGSKS